MKTNTKALIALTLTAFIWGFSSAVNKLLLPYGTPITFVTIRYLVSSSFIFGYLWYHNIFFFPNLKEFFLLLLAGCLSTTLHNTLMLVGLQYSSITNASLISATAPLFIAVTSFLLCRERLLNIQWIGILIALLSTVYILTDADITILMNMSFNQGDIIFFIAQFCWAFYTLLSARLLKTVPLLSFLGWSTFLGAIINTLYGFFTGELRMPTFNTNVIFALMYTIWGTALLALILWNYAIKNIGSSISGVFLNLSTLIGVCSGVFLYAEPVSKNLLWGALGIFIGIFLITQYEFIERMLAKSMSHR